MAEESIRELKDRSIENIWSEQPKKKKKLKRPPMGYHSEYHMYIIGVPEEKKIGTERIYEEIIAKSSPNLVKNMNLQIEGDEETPIKLTQRY